MPVNFHIGSSKGNMDFFGRAPWPSFGEERKLAVGSANLFMGNARTVGNLIYSGIPERFPHLKFVSVESGVGWLPFFLEMLDHQLTETAPNELADLSLLPSEYFDASFLVVFGLRDQRLNRLLISWVVSVCYLKLIFLTQPAYIHEMTSVSWTHSRV